eukprot:TRINITY_DN4834_c0_g1_i9.p1 TRINITY_DN4834_c0_g1~~TRINITY_DN4834_c0_g1_i9.p1  ORF type:complete len:271 (-),score=46.03 TRINITY_DN4834_c0_g1_i9:60-872(-)
MCIRDSQRRVHGDISRDSIEVANNGSTAVYYEWRKIHHDSSFQMTTSDKEERFLCHHDKNVLKPGETRRFYFSFISQIPGVFSENWILYSEPKTVQPLRPILLTGNALVEDEHISWRDELESLLNVKQRDTLVRETINDIVERVKTPTPPLPDLNDPEVCKREFEQRNERYHLWYTSSVIVWFRDLEAELYDYLRISKAQQYWDMNVDYLKDLIQSVKDDFVRPCFERKFNEYFEFAKQKPVVRSHMYDYFRDQLIAALNTVQDLSLIHI